MKKILILNTAYLNTKNLNKDEVSKKRQELFDLSVKEFKEQLKDLSKAFKVIEENSERLELTIEFSEVVWDKLHAQLLEADAVSIIDSF